MVTPEDATSASMNPTAASIGVGTWKILGLVANRSMLATTIGISVKDAPDAAAVSASSSQRRATSCCG
jgi:hypothetical protein